ncbi:MAG: hypothetical protein FWH56_08605 [Betaproteobacteria bacterium]|nr:hypothetical protein [Betaproteobacteria bacterium]
MKTVNYLLFVAIATLTCIPSAFSQTKPIAAELLGDIGKFRSANDGMSNSLIALIALGIVVAIVAIIILFKKPKE